MRGLGSEAAILEQAGVADAAGIVAGSNHDIDNLSIAMMAKRLNPDVFIVLRQNQAANDLLFDTFRADFSMVHTRVVAQECISILTTPLLARFLAAVRGKDEGWCSALAGRLEELCDGRVPEVWGVHLDRSGAPAVHEALAEGKALRLDQLLIDRADRASMLPVIVLMIEREGRLLFLPEGDCALQPGDSLLLAGEHAVRAVLELPLKNVNAFEYLITGYSGQGGWLWRRLGCPGRSATHAGEAKRQP